MFSLNVIANSTDVAFVGVALMQLIARTVGAVLSMA